MLRTSTLSGTVKGMPVEVLRIAAPDPVGVTGVGERPPGGLHAEFQVVFAQEVGDAPIIA